MPLWDTRVGDVTELGTLGLTLNGFSLGAGGLVYFTGTQQTGALTEATHTIFTVAGGPIMVFGLWGVCTAANNTNASTVQFATTQTYGSLSSTAISAASSSLASVAQGEAVYMEGSSVAGAVAISTSGAANILAAPLIIQPGSISVIVGTAAISGSWTWYILYQPLVSASVVS